jgi:hypothetical protein
MLLHAVLVHQLIIDQTPTLDEVAHLPAGESYLETGSFAMYRHSPPGARLLAGIASWPDRLMLDFEGGWRTDQPANHWRFAFETIEKHASSEASQKRYLQAFTWARHATLGWSLLAMLVLFVWGRSWQGSTCGMIAASLWAICPNIIAHASLVTTDMPATSAGLLALFFFARWTTMPSMARCISAGCMLGIAQWMKHSSLWLYLILLVWVLLLVMENRPGRGRNLFGATGIVVVSVLVLNVGYLFEGTFTRLGEFRFLSESLTRPLEAGEVNPDVAHTNNLTYRDVYARRINRFRGSWLADLLVPLPMNYVAGFDEQKFEAEGKYPMYLRGQFSEPLPAMTGPKGANDNAVPTVPAARRGWWYYYIYALAVKVPIGTWLLVGSGLILAFVHSKRGVVLVWSIFALVPIFAMSFLTDINLGLRYVLGSLPFFFLVAGTVTTAGRVGWSLVAMALGWNVIALASIHPHELSYFNEIVGGPAWGRFHLIDSNLDWGQDWRRLARWLEKHPDWSKEISMAYAGSVPGEFEGIAGYRLPPRDGRFVPDPLIFPWEDRQRPETWGPRPGRFAVSVNFERGMRFHTPVPRTILDRYGPSMGRSMLPGSAMANMPRGSLAYFREFTPIIIPEVGYSILLYDITREQADAVRQRMGLPPWPVDPL